MTLEKKVQIIKQLEKDTASGSVQRVAHQLRVPHYTVSRIKKNKAVILDAFACGFRNGACRLRKAKYPELEKQVVEWIEDRNAKGVHLTQSLIRERAAKLAEDLGINDFKSSGGWLSGFKSRNSIGSAKFHREETTVSEKTVGETLALSDELQVHSECVKKLSDGEQGEEETFQTSTRSEFVSVVSKLRQAAMMGWFGETISAIEKLEFTFDRFLTEQRKQSRITHSFAPSTQ